MGNQIALCIESSHERGMGHLYRALNLADGLRNVGVEVLFLLNSHAPTQQLLKEKGYVFEIVTLSDVNSHWEKDITQYYGINLWINDRLNTDLCHAQNVKALGLPLITFDDQGDGAYLSDVNVAALVFNDSDDLGGKLLLQGLKYLILNPEIAKFQRIRKNTNSLLVTMGGSDTYGVTVDVVKYLISIDKKATVIVGPAFSHMKELEQVITDDFELKHNVDSMIGEFHAHDLVITGGGITPVEAAASGLPSITIASEVFEIAVGHTLQNLKVTSFIGYHRAIDWSSLNSKLLELPIEIMSQAGLECVDLKGRDRVINIIKSYL